MNEGERAGILTDCAAYFSKNQGYLRAFIQMRQKWKKYGRIAGWVKLEHPSGEERKALEGFFSRELSEEPLRFSMAEFEAALGETRFAGVSLEALLRAYFHEELMTNQEEKRRQQEKRKDFFLGLLDQAVDTCGKGGHAERWMRSVVGEKKYGFHLIRSEYEKNPKAAERQVDEVCRALEYLARHPGTRLAVLGSEITRNPHEYDRNTIPGRLLIQGLSCIQGGMGCKSAEEILMLYYASGIKPDDISSFTTVYGIHFYTEAGEHPAYRGFIESGEPYVVTLSNLSRVKRAEARGKKVYIVENQMVFSHLCEALEGQEYALVCTSGQVKTASFMLLDLLREADCTMFYSGDFDPEGLGIAEKIASRNAGSVVLWHMSEEDYAASLSEEEISGESLCKLEKLSLPCLEEVKKHMLEKKKAGYQERLIEVLLEDIFRGCHRTNA